VTPPQKKMAIENIRENTEISEYRRINTIVLSRPFTDCHEICIQISRGIIKADNVRFEIFIVDP